jgi:hypothetical protein
MMRQVHISKLSDIKSVFNSPSDNEQFYRVLTNSGLTNFENIELAQPTVRQSNASVIWKAKSSGNYSSFNSLTTTKQEEVGRTLEKFYKKFKEKANEFKNVGPDFAEKIIQIPSLDSLLVDESNYNIIIVNWGFLEDSFNRSEGLISKLFPKPENSVLVNVIDDENQAVPFCELTFSTKQFDQTGLTNEKGYARFQNLRQGLEFSIKVNYPPYESLTKEFICDGRKEYCVQIKKEEIITKDSPVEPIEIDEIETGEINEVEEDEAALDEENEPIKIKFINTFNRPIKNLKVTVKEENGDVLHRNTDKNGQIFLDTNSNILNFELTRRHSPWNFTIKNDYQTNHLIKLKPLYPWIWWLVILLLLFFWLWCLLSNCNCGQTINQHSNNHSYSNPIEEKKPPEVLNCNSANKSGGEGVTKNKHFLGENTGIVSISYNMENVPDKMEVFYEGKLVGSTNEVNGNKNGFVGANLSAGCCGEIDFYYKKNKDDFCTVVLTGSNKTSWNYSISCPTP